MLLTTPAAAAAALSTPAGIPRWLCAGLGVPDPVVPVVPLLDEYKLVLPLVPKRPFFFVTELRLRLNIPLAPSGPPVLNRCSAEKALLRLPRLDSDAPPTEGDWAMGADEAR